MEIPKNGSIIQIKSLKHNYELHRCWEENTVLYSDKNIVIGGNNNTMVEEATGKRWQTTEPAIFYFDRRHWFNIIKIFGEVECYYYCNLSSPFTYKNKTLQYIDYDIDIIVKTDWSYKVVDLAEFEMNKRLYNYPLHIVQSIESNLNLLQEWIENNNEPFHESYFDTWYEKFLL